MVSDRDFDKYFGYNIRSSCSSIHATNLQEVGIPII
jgi:hypothetical protein